MVGGAGGLGLAITDDLLDNDVRVAVVDRDPQATAALYGRNLSELIVITGDARDVDVLTRLYGAVDERWGRLDTVVHCVGGTFRANFTDTTPKGWDTLLRTNLVHIMHSCSLAVPLIRRGGRGGSIVNLTTIEAHRAAPGFAVYSAAKAGLAHLARSLAVELAPERIRVNNVAPDLTPTTPGGITTGDGRSAATTGTVGGMAVGLDPTAAGIAIPMGRTGVPSDVSGTVVFLASDLSRYVTGTTIHPDGGTWASSGWFNWPDHGFLPTIPPGVTA
ncbi:SDR family NAD(P)-dependent oxidoreductase [Nocardia jinanensis]|uniref:Oxidoreductase n=1 Tax=Nocardia jinanensis TaxID=382504 RepID=A0A917RLM7_9NOCA|nr:SDR family oxidoreductase [Nocardia jinanensis]GGL13368.1 oxidoreductase [Nocardia jinanensis]